MMTRQMVKELVLILIMVALVGALVLSNAWRFKDTCDLHPQFYTQGTSLECAEGEGVTR
jgi:hypothetical protein